MKRGGVAAQQITLARYYYVTLDSFARPTAHQLPSPCVMRSFHFAFSA